MQVKCIATYAGLVTAGKLYDVIDRSATRWRIITDDKESHWLSQAFLTPVPNGTLPTEPLKISKKVYIGGALANPNIVTLTKTLLDAGYDAFSEWYTPGKEADVLWRDYELALGMDYRTALARPSAQNTFKFDKMYIDMCDTFVMLLPCGKSAHMELGYAIGRGKTGIIYMPEQPDRWDVMYNFADRVVYNDEELMETLR